MSYLHPATFISKGLSHICGKAVRAATLLSVKNLQAAESRSVKQNSLKPEPNDDESCREFQPSLSFGL